MGRNNIIELNGKTYDATTGALLGESRIRVTPASRQHNAHHGRAIDGFIRKNHGVSAPATVVKPSLPAAAAHAHALKPHAKTGKSFDMRRSSKAALKAHAPQKPKTLMRHVVQKPKIQLKTAIKTTMPSEMIARPKADIARPLEKKLSVTQVNPFRLARARQVSKSHHIRRFSRQDTLAPTGNLARIPAGAARPHLAATTQRPAHYATAQTRPEIQMIRQAPASRPAAASPANQAKESAADIFEAALAHATSHEQPAPARRQSARRRRLVNVLAGVGAFLLIGGFIGYLNVTNIELRIASMRAGFHAELPDYKPTGYAMSGGIESSEGRVAMSFRSGESNYTVTQEASDWNSATLLDQTALEQGQPTQTIQSKGRTIYIFDDSNATWVNGGVRYKISGNAALDADQLVALATSM